LIPYIFHKIGKRAQIQ